MNTFECPDHVKAAEYTAFKKAEDGYALSVPPCSLISLTIAE
jgi:hypothetical protein